MAVAVEDDGTEDTFPHHPDDLDLDWNLMTNFAKILEIIGKNIFGSVNKSVFALKACLSPKGFLVEVKSIGVLI